MNKQPGLFDNDTNSNAPLAFRARPSSIDGYLGQEHIIGKIERLDLQRLPHIIFWGPAGVGKTTLAYILADKADIEIKTFNAVMGGVADLRALIKEVMDNNSMMNKRTIIFIDEIHRFNKSQQDALLPHLEKGDFILFGATTEYPKTALNKALQSRVQLWELKKIQDDQVEIILKNALKEEEIEVRDEIISMIAHVCGGDARSALNQLESLLLKIDDINEMPLSEIKEKYLEIHRDFDKNSDRHYDVISAFIKSIRGSDIDSAVMWLAVMLDGGEDPVFIARRLMIIASEDVGLANPNALTITCNAHYVVKNIGMPEARITLSQAVVYLCQSPKSNSVYNAINSALSYVKERPTIEVPNHLRNSHPEKKNYLYPHSYPNHWIAQNYGAQKGQFYERTNQGHEKAMSEFHQKFTKGK